MKFFRKKIPAFSLIEIGMVLLVVGILFGAVLKGRDLIDVAKAHSVATQIQQIQQATQQYIEQYQALPGDDKGASRFGESVDGGNADDSISLDENKRFWVHLYESGFIDSPTIQPSRMGGQYIVQTDSEHTHWLILSETGEKGLLTPKQAQTIKSKINSISENDIKIIDGNGSTTCLKNKKPNTLITDKVCILKVKLIT